MTEPTRDSIQYPVDEAYARGINAMQEQGTLLEVLLALARTLGGGLVLRGGVGGIPMPFFDRVPLGSRTGISRGASEAGGHVPPHSVYVPPGADLPPPTPTLDAIQRFMARIQQAPFGAPRPTPSLSAQQAQGATAPIPNTSLEMKLLAQPPEFSAMGQYSLISPTPEERTLLKELLRYASGLYKPLYPPR